MADQPDQPWLLYFLIDTRTEPTNHPRGTVFYIGMRNERRPGRREPVRAPRDLGSAEVMPEREHAAKERIAEIVASGETPFVELVFDHRDWVRNSTVPTTERERLVAVLATSMYPAPLNVATRAVREVQRYRTDTVATLMRPATVTLPEGMTAAVRVVATGLDGPYAVDDLLNASPAALLDRYGTFRAVRWSTVARDAKERADSDPMLFLLVAGPRISPVVPEGLILGVWHMIDVRDLGDGPIRVEVADDTPTVAAVRRRYLHKVIEVPLTREGLHRIEGSAST